MFGTMNCTYETPCGWCTKWEKKCDKKIPERGQREKCDPIDDYMDEPLTETLTNQICKSDFDHEWECCGVSTAGSDYRCKKCGAHKFVPIKTKSLKTYLTEPSVVEEIVSNVIKEN